jgi:hypothetical protein
MAPVFVHGVAPHVICGVAPVFAWGNEDEGSPSRDGANCPSMVSTPALHKTQCGVSVRAKERYSTNDGRENRQISGSPPGEPLPNIHSLQDKQAKNAAEAIRQTKTRCMAVNETVSLPAPCADTRASERSNLQNVRKPHLLGFLTRLRLPKCPQGTPPQERAARNDMQIHYFYWRNSLCVE